MLRPMAWLSQLWLDRPHLGSRPTVPLISDRRFLPQRTQIKTNSILFLLQRPKIIITRLVYDIKYSNLAPSLSICLCVYLSTRVYRSLSLAAFFIYLFWSLKTEKDCWEFKCLFIYRLKREVKWKEGKLKYCKIKVMYLYNVMIKYKASKVISTVERQHTLQMVTVYQQ